MVMGGSQKISDEELSEWIKEVSELPTNDNALLHHLSPPTLSQAILRNRRPP